MTLNITKYLQDLQATIADLNQQIKKTEENILEENIAAQLARNSVPSEVAAELESYEAPDFELNLPTDKVSTDVGQAEIVTALNKIFKLN